MRDDATLIIADNPVSIVITRKTYTLANGKRSKATSTLSAQTVRLYSTKGTRSRSGDDNRWTWEREVKMLCAYDADVKAHSNEYEDTFSANGVTYLVKDVNDVRWNGAIVSKQCVLEELDA